MQFELLKAHFSHQFAAGFLTGYQVVVVVIILLLVVVVVAHARKHNLHGCEILWQQLKVCNTNFL